MCPHPPLHLHHLILRRIWVVNGALYFVGVAAAALVGLYQLARLKEVTQNFVKNIMMVYLPDYWMSSKFFMYLIKKRRMKREVKCSKTSNLCYSSVEHCYLNLPEDMVEDNPLDLENIKEKQDEADKLTQSTVTHPTWYSHKTINDVEVEDMLCYTKPGDNEANWRIALPEI